MNFLRMIFFQGKYSFRAILSLFAYLFYKKSLLKESSS
ncbi:Hypothetical protein Minf_1394 [Methylacidiphilum infernorum V4]|uniref:Uncharacterized protein n=1 Tax=Methylacidiphilum infernorum (isolate V4) TaxID=481448 RepID=B3DVU5_METI4|nr:Hypothetical protein Minf_1394 [Methylacidiphilum infernorum V4]